jgi:C4-dicarboxylate-specific signal transduction histidine kinase
MVMVTIWGAVHGLGPFAGGAPQDTARDMQLFLIAVSVPLLLLAVVLEERARAAREAHEQRLQLTHLSRVATLGEMSGGLAHELNQPLTAILSNAQAAQLLLADPRADRGELTEILVDIVTADRRASDIIQRVRALFKKSAPQLQPLEPNELAAEVLELVHGDIMARNVAAHAELAPGLPRVRGDRIQLQQVLINLVMNACEAMAAVPVERRVLTLRTALAPDGGAQVSVIDRGPGFAAELHETLFTAFYSTRPNGLGLGLSISRSIVAAHGGELWGSSIPGQGASFHLVLPPNKT